MMHTPAGRLLTAAVPSATALVLALGLTACQGQAALSTASASPAGSASSTASSDPVSTTSPPPAAGSLSVSVTSPVTVSGSASRPVSCIAGLAYRASVSSAVIDGDQFSASVVVAGYHGPGTYPAVVAVTLRQASGLVTTVTGVSRVPAVITAAGGSFSVSATGSAGRTFTGSLSWVCGS